MSDIKIYDKGSLPANEMMLKSDNFKKEPTEEEVKLFDFNGNGKIDSDNEINAYNNFTTARDNAKLELKFDIDGDGKLNYPEKLALKAYKKGKADLAKVDKDIAAKESNFNTVDNKVSGKYITDKKTDETNELDSINNKISKLELKPAPEPEEPSEPSEPSETIPKFIDVDYMDLYMQ